MIYVQIKNKQFEKQIHYVFDTVFHILGIKYKVIDFPDSFKIFDNDILIVYDNDMDFIETDSDVFKNTIFIKGSNLLFGNNYLEIKSLPCTIKRYKSKNFSKYNSDTISLYNDNDDLYFKVKETSNIVITNIDIISDIFFMLTGYEEFVNTEVLKKEPFKRFTAKESIAYRYGFLNRPIVNEHIELLWSCIEGFHLGYERMDWWEQKDFAACLTHDIDSVQTNKSILHAVKYTLAILLKHKDMKKAFCFFKDYLINKHDYKKDPYWTFDYIMNMEKKFGFSSSFYFMSTAAAESVRYYDIKDLKIRSLVHEIESNGFEAGYHGSFGSYNNPDLLIQEKQQLDSIILRKPYGCRQHYLRFHAPYTWEFQQQAGILYDTTLSYPDREGFRCGICFPYKPYNIVEDKVVDIWEIPLLVMDAAFNDYDGSDLTPANGLKKIIELIETVKYYKGVFVLLWHNSSFGYNWEGWRFVFEETMEYLWKLNCYAASGREIIDHIKLHSRL